MDIRERMEAYRDAVIAAHVDNEPMEFEVLLEGEIIAYVEGLESKIAELEVDNQTYYALVESFKELGFEHKEESTKLIGGGYSEAEFPPQDIVSEVMNVHTNTTGKNT